MQDEGHQLLLTNWDKFMQVQAIGLQVLKGMLQRGVTSESNSFIIFFVGELVEDIIAVIHKYLKVFFTVKNA